MAFLAGLRTRVVCRTQVDGVLSSLGGGDPTEASYEQNQLPGIVIRPGTAPGWHAGELYAVLDDVVDFAVGEMLRRLRTQVRNSWIKIRPDRCFPAAIDPVAGGTMRQEGIPPLLQKG